MIKEGVEKLHIKTLIENRLSQINEEFKELGFSGPTLNSMGQSYSSSMLGSLNEDGEYGQAEPDMNRGISHGPILDAVSISKDTIVKLFASFITDKFKKDKMESALESINFFGRYDLEEGYDLDSIVESFYRMDAQDVEDVLMKVVG